jgi:hypothetical protein
MNQAVKDETEYTDDVEVVGDEATTQKGYEVEEPEPEKAGQVSASKDGNGRNYKFLAAYVIGVFIVVVVGIFAFIYMRGGNTQNANIKVSDKNRAAANNPNSTDSSDPTYEEATSIIKPVTNPQTSGTPIPPQGQVPPQTTSGGTILAEPTTGYTLGGNTGTDYVFPKPQPSPDQNVVKNGNSTSGGNTNFSRSGDNQKSSDEKPILPKVISNESETTPVSSNALLKTASNSSGNTSIYYYASATADTQEKELTSRFEKGNAPVNLPFGTVLPVRLMGALHSLTPGGYARMELTRAVSNGQYFIPRGTQFVGRLQGDAADRIFIELIGYLDKRGNLVKMSGDVLNTDGSIGVKGKREKLGSKWKRYLAPVAETARQFGMAYLQGRTNSNVFVLPQDSTIPVLGEANNNRRQNTEFVSVAAGQFAYIFINNLPPATGGGDGFSDSARMLSTDGEIKALTNDSIDADTIYKNLSPELRRQISANRK